MDSFWEVFSDGERPLIETLPGRGQGVIQLRYHDQGPCYLIRHAADGSPQLMGKVTTKCRKVKGKYYISYIPSQYLPTETRQEIESLLAPYIQPNSSYSEQH